MYTKEKRWDWSAKAVAAKQHLGRTLLRLIEPTAGKIIYNGTDLTAKKRDELKIIAKRYTDRFPGPLFFAQSKNNHRFRYC